MLPKVSDMSSFSGSHKSLMASSAEPHILVCCPSCSTKFAVESSAVASFENPRFHCSRCDAVFSLSENQPEPSAHNTHQSENGDTPRWVLSDPAKVISDQAQEKQPLSSQTLKATDFSIGASAHPSFSGKLSDARDYTPRIMTSADKSPEALSMNAGLSLLTQGQANLDPQRTIADEPQNLTQQAPSDEPRLRGAFRHHNRPAIPQAPGKETLSEVEQEMLAEIGRAEGRGPLSRAFATLFRRTRTLGRLALPLGGSLCLLTLLTYSSRVSPGSMDALISAVIPSPLSDTVPKLPPSELAMKDLSLRFIRTPNREVVAVISGQLVNTSQEAISDVTLEALGFNDRGEVVIKSRAPLRSALSKEKIADLNQDTIQKFQHALGARDASIAPSETVPFSVALLGDEDEMRSGSSVEPDLSSIRYFSARVFSVR